MKKIFLIAALLCFSGESYGQLVTPQGGTTASQLSTVLGRIISVDDFGAKGDGVTDDTGAINAALTQCTGSTGGSVMLSEKKQYLVNSGNLLVRQTCVFGNRLWVGDQRLNSPHNNNSSVPAIILNPTFTINMQQGASIDGLAIFNATVSQPSSLRQAIQGVANFAGTAITVPGPAGSTLINNVYIMGFNQCVIEQSQRFTLSNMRGDCINGILVQNCDSTCVIKNVEFWPFYEQNNGFGNPATYAVTNVTNSSGTCQITLGSGTQVLEGDIISVYNVGGYTGVNNRWTVTSIDGNGNVLLSGCQNAPSVLGTWSSGSSAISVASTNSLAIGQGVSGTNISSNSVINYVDYFSGTIYLNNPTTGAGSSVSLTFSNGSYTSGGTVRLGTYRTGRGLDISQANEVKVSKFLDEEHDTGIYLKGTLGGSGQGTYWAKLIDASCDTGFPSDPATACVYLDNDGTHIVMGLSWIGGYTSSVGTPLYLNGLNPIGTAATNTIVGVHFGTNPTTNIVLSAQSGATTIADCDFNNANASQNGGILVSDSVKNLTLSADQFSQAVLQFNTAAGKKVTFVDQLTQIAAAFSTTVGNLPTCNAAFEGKFLEVTDANSPTYNGTLTGGGSTKIPVWCNSSVWTAH